MNHYFTQDPSVESNRKLITVDFRGQTYEFITDDGVFSKGRLDYGTQVLLDAIIDELSGRVLDLGCGYGAVGVLVALLRRLDVTMVDVNSRAVELSRSNVKKHRVQATVLSSDGFENVTGFYDYILLNPPIRAGKAVIYRLFDEASHHLTAGGRLVIVIQKKQGAESAKRKLEDLFDEVETIDRSGGFHVMVARKSALANWNAADHEETQTNHEGDIDNRRDPLAEE